MVGAETDMRDEVVVVKRDGGRGNERARLKRWITV